MTFFDVIKSVQARSKPLQGLHVKLRLQEAIQEKKTSIYDQAHDNSYDCTPITSMQCVQMAKGISTKTGFD